jgi:hypothetical protein
MLSSFCGVEKTLFLPTLLGYAGMLGGFPMTFLNLFGSAFLGFPFQFFGVLAFTITHFLALLSAIGFLIQIFVA